MLKEVLPGSQPAITLQRLSWYINNSRVTCRKYYSRCILSDILCSALPASAFHTYSKGSLNFTSIR